MKPSTLGLEGQEFVSLLQWVEQTYPGSELMGSTALNIDKHLIPPLLNPEVVDALMTSYLDNMRENYNSWMQVSNKIRRWSKFCSVERIFCLSKHSYMSVLDYT